MTAEIKIIDNFTAQLKKWYETDFKGYKTIFDKTIANVQTIPEWEYPRVKHDWGKKGNRRFVQIPYTYEHIFVG